MMENSEVVGWEEATTKYKEKDGEEDVGNSFGIVKHKYKRKDKDNRKLFLHEIKQRTIKTLRAFNYM